MAVPKRIASPKEWKFPAEFPADDSLIEVCDGSEILARLLVRRGLSSAQEVAAYLDPGAYRPSSPMELLDMGRALARINKAIDGNEKISIYGDYDVDGVTATAVMVTTLRLLGADVDYYIPTRIEGYGLNLKAISVLASKHRTRLIISCDCGISNFSEINFAKSLGVDTIVVDHHSMPDLMPPAAAILHPKLLPEDHPFYHLPGVGVAYKLAEALLLDKAQPQHIPDLLDLVTLGMIADMVPLVKECRYLVQVGMPKLVGSNRLGIKALFGQVGARDGGTELVGFGLAPRINAVGRLSDANTAVRLMITTDAAEAGELARQLEYDNLRRQELCEEIFLKVDQSAQLNVQAGDKAIAVYGEGWHHGVVGIVASRMVEKYHCPVFIGELDSAEGIVKGSARGIEAVDLYEVLKANEHLALKWGGHKMAAGFSVELGKADLFFKSLVETCNRMLAERSMTPTLSVDLESKPAEVTQELATLLTRMAPFGIGNKKPVVVLRNLKCSGARPLGKEAKHSRISVKAPTGHQFECVYWNSQQRVPADGQIIDVAFMPDINTYNGASRLQLVLADWRDHNQAPQVVQKVSGIGVPTGGKDGSAVAAAPHTDSYAGEVNQADQSFAPASRSGPTWASVAAPASTSASTSTSVSTTTPASAFNSSSTPAAKSHTGSAATRGSGQGRELLAQGQRNAQTPQQRNIIWKDLRVHSDPGSILPAAVRKLGNGINIFGEGCPVIPGITLVDRTALQSSGHLLMWQNPPSLSVFKQIIDTTSATNVYLVGAAPVQQEDGSSFLKRLLGLVRFAVNHREGQADPEKIGAALASTKMTIALGLTVLKKINVIDWFAEDGRLYVDLLGQPSSKPEELPEFRQLSKCLREIAEFRLWCQSATTAEIQLALTSIKLAVVASESRKSECNDDPSLEQNDVQGKEGYPQQQPTQLPSK